MLRTIHLHGRLGHKFGRTHQFEINSVAEGVRALAYQLPGFEKYIQKRSYAVSVGEGEVLGLAQVEMGLGKSRDIHITPAGMVSGLETILLAITLAISVVSVGYSLLAMPKAPKASDREDATKTASFGFDGAQQNVEQGNPVPLIYGRMRVGSVVVSGGIETTDVNGASLATDPANPDYSGGGGGPEYIGYIGTTPGIRGSEWGDEWIALDKGGGKGGGGGARSAEEDANNLQSQATARILEVIGEGEIVGLVDGMKSVYFDDTVLQNPDGTFNFAGVSVDQRVGLPDQDFIPGFTQTENTAEVGAEVKISSGPVTRTISDADATVARVTIRLPQLYEQDTKNGDLKSSTVSVKVSVQTDGGGFTDVATMEFVGKTTQGYERSVDIRLPNGTTRDIRVTRITADSTLSSLVNQTYFSLLTAIVEAKLSYPDTALIGLTVAAKQFGSSIPVRSYEVKGLIVEVPTNYDPVTRAYTGLWDGTFKRAWTDCPPWIFRDIIVNRRYGLGARVPASAIDKWALYAIAQYCDGLVPDGFGGTQPRFTMNCSINNAAAAADVLAAMASNFRAFIYWGSGSIVAAQDRPEDPSILVNRTNVVDGMIDYGRVTPLEQRRSVGVVYWNDPADGYKLVPEIYENPDLIRRFGYKAGNEVNGFGITSKGQAHRACRWLLEDESKDSNTSASYKVGDDHMLTEPGRIVAIEDKMYSLARRGGRAVSATANSVTLDAPFIFVSGLTYRLRIMQPDGTVRLRDVTNSPGTATVVTLSGSAFSSTPNPGAVWTIETTALASRQFRMRAIATDEAPYSVRAVSHDPTKYDRVDADRDLSDSGILTPRQDGLSPPGDIGAFEYLLQDGTASIPCVLVSWAASPDTRVLFYQAQFKRPGSEWQAFNDSSDLSRFVRNAEPGVWGFRVRALDSLGRKTAWRETTATLDGQTDSLPEVVSPGLSINSNTFTAQLVWDAPVDIRPLRYEIMYHATSTSIGAAASLGVTDRVEYTILNPGNYWIRTRFIDFNSTAPVRVNVPEIVFSAGIVPYLTNEAFVVDAATDGTVSSYSGASGSFVIMSGATDVSASFTLSTPSGGNPQTLSVTYTGLTYSVTAGLDPGEATATLRIRATGSGVYAGVVLDKVFSLSKSRQGATGAAGLNNAIVYAYQRAASAPTLPSATVTYTFATGAMTGLNNGWSATIPAGTNPLYVTAASASAAGATDTIAAGEWASAVVLAANGSNGSNGTNGLNAATVFLYQRATSAPAVPSASLTYTFATGILGGGSLSGWSQSVPSGSNPIYLTTATAVSTGTTDTIAAGEWAGVIVLAQNGVNGSNGTDGSDGNYRDIKFKRQFAQPATPSGSSPSGWSDGVPGGTETLWSITATKTFAGALIGGWSTPQSLSGLTPRGPYNGGTTYYLNNTVTFSGGSYIAVQNNFSGQAPSGTGSATAYWDVLSAPGEQGAPGDPPSGFSATINLSSGAAVNLRTVADANGYTGASDATITFNVPSGATIRGLSGGGIGLDTGTWPTSSYSIALTLVVQSGGIVDGGGGIGGDASYGSGGEGGDAIYVRVPMTGGITVNSGGTVRAGGGGGGAGYGELVTPPGEFSSPDDPYFGGGGGGGGAPNGAGGSGEGGTNGGTSGSDGSSGTTSGGGGGGSGFTAGAGGGTFGAGGGSSGGSGGAAGYAVRKNGNTVSVSNSGTLTGTAA